MKRSQRGYIDKGLDVGLVREEDMRERADWERGRKRVGRIDEIEAGIALAQLTRRRAGAGELRRDDRLDNEEIRRKLGRKFKLR